MEDINRAGLLLVSWLLTGFCRKRTEGEKRYHTRQKCEHSLIHTHHPITRNYHYFSGSQLTGRHELSEHRPVARLCNIHLRQGDGIGMLINNDAGGEEGIISCLNGSAGCQDG
jgi:hypothetical protein